LEEHSGQYLHEQGWVLVEVDGRHRIPLVRYRYGTFFGLGMALHNTYHMKQTIIKNAISLTKSKNPMVVRMVITAHLM
jgi:hypothetical protein